MLQRTLALSLSTVVLVLSGCVLEPEDRVPFGTVGASFGEELSESGGDGDPGDGDPGTGDGDPTTTGDGDPTTTGDGDPGNGDGDPGGCDGPSPYMGGWDIGCCQDSVTPGGWQPEAGPGTVIPDWTMTDQFGDSVRLYDFCHDAIYFEYAAVW